MPSSSKSLQVLIVNPGSTSTKVAIYNDTTELSSAAITHGANELTGYKSVADQEEFRTQLVRRFLETHLADGCIAAVGARGGLLRPLVSGVYEVNAAMLADLRAACFGEHASNLGALIAARLAVDCRCRAYIADPVVVDEMEPVARLSGLPEIERRSIFHALNQKSSGRLAARQIGKRYEDCNLIVAHLGGGISVGAHRAGRVIDVNNALDGDGPFAAERSGGLPAWQLVQLAAGCAEGIAGVRRKITGRGGLVAYCGTNDLQEVYRRAAGGDAAATSVCAALAYQISKEIAMHGATLRGEVDAIVLTGGMAGQQELVEEIKGRVAFLAPVIVLPGEREMIALAENVCAVLRGERAVLQY